MATKPRGILFDYGGTLVEEVEFNTRAGLAWLLSRAVTQPNEAQFAHLARHSDRVSSEVAERRDTFQIETPWTSLTRLIHDACGTRFHEPVADLELQFWDASVKTRPMPGVREALQEFYGAQIRMGVVSNTSFSQATIRHELSKHGLSDFLPVHVTSAEYAVRKPNPLIFEAAAGLLGLPCEDIWFVGDRIDTDIDGATAAGMNPIWFSPQNDSGFAGIHLAVSSWAELATMVREADLDERREQ